VPGQQILRRPEQGAGLSELVFGSLKEAQRRVVARSLTPPSEQGGMNWRREDRQKGRGGWCHDPNKKGIRKMKIYLKPLPAGEVLVTCGFCVRAYVHSDDHPTCPECGMNRPYDPDPTAVQLVLPPAGPFGK
jgi:hypothetical protein